MSEAIKGHGDVCGCLACEEVRFKTVGFEESDALFRHSLKDTILLLGGRLDIAMMVKKSLDGQLSYKDVHDLRNYNCDLIQERKLALANLNTMKIQVKPNEE